MLNPDSDQRIKFRMYVSPKAEDGTNTVLNVAWLKIYGWELWRLTDSWQQTVKVHQQPSTQDSDSLRGACATLIHSALA